MTFDLQSQACGVPLTHRLTALACSLILLLCAVAVAADRPNIVIIYGDDVGYGDVGCYGATGVQTPNVDRLAKEGLRFTSAYCSSATCTPSRYSLLTGEYAWRRKGTGILPGDAALIIEPGRTTLPSVLKKAGYTTAVVGKWHLGLGDQRGQTDWNGIIKPGPLEIGFDYSFIMAATGDRVPCVYVENHKVVNLDPADPIQVSYGKPFPGLPTGITHRDQLRLNWSHGHNNAVINGVGRIGFMKGGASAVWVDEDMADVFARQAVAFIERSKDKPFFLYFATHDIHVPRMPHQRFVGKSTMGRRGDAIAQFDWCTGQILQTLDRLKLSDNTLVILTSDNGPVLDDGYQDEANEKLGAHKPAGPFRGGKYSMFEGGTRMPFIVRWPARVKRDSASDAIISQVDFTASLGALAGQTLTGDDAPDSLNVLPALLGESATGRDHIIEHAGNTALRVGDWKYIPPGQTREALGPWKNVRIAQPGALFNLAEDPGESKDLAAQHPERTREMAQKLSALKESGRTRPK